MNEQFVEIIRDHPHRFGAFAVVPMDDIEAALNVAATAAEVEYAQTRCEAGLTQEALRDRLQDGRLKH
jgi:predicted TIM-barrel fold metal-dependent hydrolase